MESLKGDTTMKLKLKDILPNPYRDLLRNPLKKDKLQELESSINDTGFWDNVVVRKNAEGKYELAYGHHRWQAAINAGFTEADFIVKKLDDALMLKIMDNENRETYGADLMSVMESIEGVVKALAAGKVGPFAQKEKTKDSSLIYAPSFVPGKVPSSQVACDHTKNVYTIADVARFFGRMYKNDTQVNEVILAAFAVLEMEEHGVEEWTRKSLLKRGIPGIGKPLKTIPAAGILQHVTSAKQMARKRREAAQNDATDAKAKGVETKATLDALLAERITAAEEEERIAAEYAEAAREKNVAEARRLKEELKEKEAEDKARDTRIKEAEKAEKKAKKEEAKSERKAEETEKRNAEKAAQRWLDHNFTLIGKLERTFSEGEGLYAELIKWRLDKRTTEPQRVAMQLALRDLSARAANFNPYTGPAKKEKRGVL
jgi:chemotaxis protein histidine kinase CheA